MTNEKNRAWSVVAPAGRDCWLSKLNGSLKVMLSTTCSSYATCSQECSFSPAATWHVNVGQIDINLFWTVRLMRGFPGASASECLARRCYCFANVFPEFIRTCPWTKDAVSAAASITARIVTFFSCPIVSCQAWLSSTSCIQLSHRAEIHFGCGWSLV